MKYFQMGIFVIPGVCLIRKYWSQTTAFFSVFQCFSGYRVLYLWTSIIQSTLIYVHLSKTTGSLSLLTESFYEMKLFQVITNLFDWKLILDCIYSNIHDAWNYNKTLKSFSSILNRFLRLSSLFWIKSTIKFRSTDRLNPCGVPRIHAIAELIMIEKSSSVNSNASGSKFAGNFSKGWCP